MQTASWRDELLNVATSTTVLPVFDGFIMECLRMASDRTASFGSIADAIRHDQSISAKIVGIANSAFYSRGVPIFTLQRAMVAVGLEQTKEIITCIIFMNGILKHLRLPREACMRLTRHALLVTYTAQKLAEKTLAVHPQKAFIAGLLHDIGKIIFCLRDRSYLAAADQAVAESGDVCGFERATYGVDHEETGYYLSTKWRLPEELVRVVSQHHQSVTDSVDPLVRIVRGAQTFWTQAGQDMPLEAIILSPERQGIEQQVERIASFSVPR